MSVPVAVSMGLRLVLTVVVGAVAAVGAVVLLVGLMEASNLAGARAANWIRAHPRADRAAEAIMVAAFVALLLVAVYAAGTWVLTLAGFA